MPLLDRLQERAADIVGRRLSAGNTRSHHTSGSSSGSVGGASVEHSPSPPRFGSALLGVSGGSKRLSADHGYNNESSLSSFSGISLGGAHQGGMAPPTAVCGSMVAALLSSAASTLTQVNIFKSF